MTQESGWTYYSNEIRGYAEKYGNRGMRERNRLLLDGIKFHPEAKEQLIDLLAENNLPLAMRCARSFQHLHGTTESEMQDDFQDACIAMLDFIRSENITEIPQAYFQVRLYKAMSNSVWSNHRMWYENAVVFTESIFEFIPTDFDQVEDARDPKADKSFLLHFVRTILPERSARIVELYFFGDGMYIEPGDTETIGMYYGLSRSRISQIVSKSMRKLRRTSNLYFVRERREEFWT